LSISIDGVRNILSEVKQELSRLYGARLKQVALYGSWARGDATDDSDIDLAIVLEGDVNQVLEIDRMIDVIFQTNLKYGVLISVYPVSEADYQAVRSPLLLNLRREAVPA